ncbi:MAG: ribulokinase [Anaerolineaceae bacterium]|nr:ribulokinase [Anaerolineaceae bacterium]
MSGKSKFTIGIEFGNEIVTALLVNVSNGKCANVEDYQYTHGIITDRLPDSNIELAPGWALHHPRDYITALKRIVPRLLKGNNIDASQVIGIGVSFADSTLIPTTEDGTPLSQLDDYKDDPNAWPKIGRHSAAKDKADKITELAADRFETFLDRYGGRINAEWFFPKVWETYDESSSIYNAADRLIEGCDWITWQLTGVESRSITAAGYKALWSTVEGFPLETFFSSLDPALANVVDEKMSREISPLGQKVGELSEEAARWLKLNPGIPVATGMMNNQAAVPAAGVVEPGNMAILLGTRFVHMVLSKKEYRVPGMVGMVRDGIIPDYIGYEAGQASGGDQFAWFMENAVPEEYAKEARRRKISLFEYLEEKAAALEPAESGLIALDWWNGNRSILVDDDLSGLILGYNLKTKPEEIYRALLEASAYGTRKIIETFIASGIPINEIIVSGGAPMKNKLLLKILADVTRMEIKVADCPHSSAMGAAMYAAVAAGEENGGYATIQDASQKMAHLMTKTFLPNNNDKKTYNRLYSEYTLLHDYFGYGHNDAMKRLKNLRSTILEKKQS